MKFKQKPKESDKSSPNFPVPDENISNKDAQFQSAMTSPAVALDNKLEYK